MAVFYNEIDPYAAEWLRNLVREGLLPDGEVSTASIVDLRPSDLAGFTSCHFFAGLGGWAYAARLAGWPDDRPLWTGSCPCQPFSVAGKGAGVDDPRHLWPHFFRLIRACRPPVVMGEQVAGAAGYGWLNGVVSDLASEGYAGRGVDIPACAVDAPHIRSRLYWVAVDDTVRGRHVDPLETLRPGRDGTVVADGVDMADASDGGWREERADAGGIGAGDRAQGRPAGSGAGDVDLDMADAHIPREGNGRLQRCGQQRGAGGDPQARDGVGMADPDSGMGRGRPDEPQRRPEGRDADRRAGEVGDVGHPNGARSAARLPAPAPGGEGIAEELDDRGCGQPWDGQERGRNGTFWSDHVWLAGADGKARRAQPGLPLLAHGAPARVGRLRAYGNAIVPQLAAEVIAAFMECEP